jgi:hypothetical protein
MFPFPEAYTKYSTMILVDRCWSVPGKFPLASRVSISSVVDCDQAPNPFKTFSIRKWKQSLNNQTVAPPVVVTFTVIAIT